MLFGVVTLGLGLIYAAHLGTTGQRVVHEFQLLSSGGYYHLLAEPFRVRGGTDARSAGIAGRLARAGLRRTFGRPSRGEVRVGHDAIEYRRGDDDRVVTLELTDGIVSGIRIDGEYADWADLPPEHLTSFRTSLLERRAPVPYSDLPPALVAAACGAEDRRFFEHRGVDMRGIVRALVRNLSHGRVVEGGSTITQQTVKVILNRTRRELPAKIDEAVLALLVERRFSKQQILAVYLNNVYLGHEGPFDIYGVAEGARFFFGKPLAELSDDQNCQLAASIRAPNAASPRRNPERLAAYARAIARAAEEVHLPEPAAVATQEEVASSIPLALATTASTGDRIDFDRAQLGYYMDILDDEWQAIRKRYRVERPAVVVASVDPVLQLCAAEGLVHGLENLPARKHKEADAPLLQGGLASVDPTNGALRAVVGGRDYVQAPFNRAVNITRQVGSTFKPFVYLSALGDTDGEPKFSQSTSLPDTLREYQVGQQVWAPANFDHQFRGWVTARQALEQSINAPTVALGMEVGVHRVAELADEVGIQEKVPEHPSILLGAVGTSPVRLASAYACLPNGGYAVRPYALREVIANGKVIEPERPARRRVASSAGAYVVTDMLVGALRNGTGRSAMRLGFRHLGAGKTGTSDQARDTWFVGFTPELVTAVWVGYDDNAPTGFSGSSAALPVWVNTMSAWLGSGWDVQFDVPPGIVFCNIDPLTGGLANSTCPDVEMAAYLDGTAPDGYCPLHSPSFGDRLDRMFGPDGKQPESQPRKSIWDRFKSLIGT
jgi:penicillin-binding protein 1B